VVDVPTGVYAYHQMHSSFWDRETGDLLKFSMSSNDSCGNSFKLGWLDGRSLRLTYHTYWTAKGTGGSTSGFPRASCSTTSSRSSCAPCGERPSRRNTACRSTGSDLVATRPPEPQPATIVVTPSGAQRIVEVRSAAGLDRFTFDASFPYTLESWSRADGSTLTLRKAQRLDYWNHSRPGDEKLRE